MTCPAAVAPRSSAPSSSHAILAALVAAVLTTRCGSAPQRQESQPGTLSWSATADSTGVTLAPGLFHAMTQVPSGVFQRGSALPADSVVRLFGADPAYLKGEYPPRTVRIERGFWMSRCEITNTEFAAFVAATGYRTLGERQGFAWVQDSAGDFVRRNGLSWRRPGWTLRPRQPVVMVAWEDARAFARWLSASTGKSFRLPTSSEWEYACKAGTSSQYGFGNDSAALRDHAWYRGNTRDAGRPFPQDVATRLPNKWGLYDLHGNVWEWCEDSNAWWDRREAYIRGGSWLNRPASLRAAYVALEHRRIVEPHFGFRVVMVSP